MWKKRCRKRGENEEKEEREQITQVKQTFALQTLDKLLKLFVTYFLHNKGDNVLLIKVIKIYVVT